MEFRRLNGVKMSTYRIKDCINHVSKANNVTTFDLLKGSGNFRELRVL